jgi:hypothetical protein
MPIQPLPQTEPQANHLGPFVWVKSKAILGLGRLARRLFSECQDQPHDSHNCSRDSAYDLIAAKNRIASNPDSIG